MRTFTRGLKERGDDFLPLVLALALFGVFLAAGLGADAPLPFTLALALLWPAVWVLGVWEQGKEAEARDRRR